MKLKTKYAARMRGELEGLLGCPVEAVRTLAVEIAMRGAQGINSTKRYALKGLPNRGEMYGEKVLAYVLLCHMGEGLSRQVGATWPPLQGRIRFGLVDG